MWDNKMAAAIILSLASRLMKIQSRDGSVGIATRLRTGW